MPRPRRDTARSSKASPAPTLAKAATGIEGFDEITGGGLPARRPTLVCGGPGCGKTLFALQFTPNGGQIFQQHLPKPIDPGRLIQAIHELNQTR
jgi:predicted ATP-dependent serine protease